MTEPVTHDEEAVDAARKLFAGPCDFMLGVVSMDTLPDGDTTEIAFAGRSNVGKSSLLNALTGRNNLARASNTPGRTRELNFFDLGGVMKLVDLPGYGYAKTSRKAADAWTRLTRDYLRGRTELRRICVLVDARHGLKPSDLEIADILDKSAVNYQFILTKTDKIKPTEIAKVIEATTKAVAKRPAAHPVILPTSSQTGFGLPELRAELASLV